MSLHVTDLFMKCHLKLHIDIDIDMVDWPIAIKKQIPSRTRSDQLLQKLIYAIRYSQLLITFAVFDVFVCISFMCLRVHVDLVQPLAARNNKRCSNSAPIWLLTACVILLLLCGDCTARLVV